MTLFGYTPAQVRKALVAAVGILTTLLTANLLPATWNHWVSGVVGLLTAALTYVVPNAAAAAARHGEHEAAR